MTTPQFTPKYLRELRIQQESTLDMELVEMIQNKILKANSKGKTYTRIDFRAERGGKLLWQHFTNLGFRVSSSDRISAQYDGEGNEIYYIDFSWAINNE